MKRRDFIKKATIGAGAFYIVPRHVLGKGYIPPSDKLNIAAIGAGGKGETDIINAYNEGKNNVVSLVDIDYKRAEKAIKKFDKATLYTDYREMLDKEGKNIDAITVSTPDHTHANIALAAMQLGKHVYVQKPLAHNIREVRLMTEAARKYKVVSQMGNQGASGDGVAQMIKWYNEGIIGKVNTVYCWTNRPVWPQGIPVPSGTHAMPDGLNWDAWVGPAQTVDYNPAYHPFKWRGWWNFGTGALGDMGCHMIDPPFRILELGYPTEVEGSVGAMFLKDWTPEYIPEGCPPSSTIRLKFPATKKTKGEVTMYWMDGGTRPFHPDFMPANEPLSSDGGANGAMLVGTKGVMVAEVYGRNPIVYLKGGKKITQPKVQNAVTLPEYGHQASWAEACKAGFGSDLHKKLTSSFDYSGPMTETVLMGNLAIRSYNLRKQRTTGSGFDYYGRTKLLWDGVNMKITNLADANQFVTREYRKGWEI